MSHIEEIKAALNSIVKDSHSNQWGDAEWTKEIKNRLCNLGNQKGYWTYASCETSDGGEWLYDITWLTYSDEKLLNTELVLESEWDIKGIDFDFQKLLLAKAELKALVFQQKSAKTAHSKFDDLRSQVMRYTKTTNDEHYLFTCWIQDERTFLHQTLRT